MCFHLITFIREGKFHRRIFEIDFYLLDFSPYFEFKCMFAVYYIFYIRFKVFIETLATGENLFINDDKRTV